jgi:hypothetical protein
MCCYDDGYVEYEEEMESVTLWKSEDCKRPLSRRCRVGLTGGFERMQCPDR